jgi:hypothetical protein
MANNSRVTAQQLALLNQALELGILSPVKHQEVLEWDQQERNHRATLTSTPIEVQPVRPRFSSEVSVKELAVQIAVRELQLANELPAGPYRHREEEYRKGKLDSYASGQPHLELTPLVSQDRVHATDRAHHAQRLRDFQTHNAAQSSNLHARVQGTVGGDVPAAWHLHCSIGDAACDERQCAAPLAQGAPAQWLPPTD